MSLSQISFKSLATVTWTVTECPSASRMVVHFVLYTEAIPAALFGRPSTAYISPFAAVAKAVIEHNGSSRFSLYHPSIVPMFFLQYP